MYAESSSRGCCETCQRWSRRKKVHGTYQDVLAATVHGSILQIQRDKMLRKLAVESFVDVVEHQVQ